jgi:hypothetical protein
MFHLTITFHPALCIFCVYFISLSLSRANGASYIWQMVHTHTGDFTQDAPEPSNAHAEVATNELRNIAHRTPPPPPPPPPPVSLEQLLATQNELMRVLTENLMQCEARPPHRQPGVETSYTDFLVTHPLTFAEAIDPLEANNWLHIIESKFGLLHCTEIQKTLFAAQQLHGPVSAWWANFTATIQDGHQVPWAEFYMAFRGHHIPTGLMACKLQEFLHMPQGSSSVYEYSKKFNHLSQYGSYHVDTNEKKMSLFLQGLSPVLHEHLMLFRGYILNELVRASIEQEDACCARLEEERKKRPLPGPNGSAPPKYHQVYTPPSGQPRGPPSS